MSGARLKLRRLALFLAGFSVLLGVVSLVAFLWVIRETDVGLLCGEPQTDFQPAACDVYSVPQLGLIVAVLLFVAAAVLWGSHLSARV